MLAVLTLLTVLVGLLAGVIIISALNVTNKAERVLYDLVKDYERRYK